MFFYGSPEQFAEKCVDFERCCCSNLDCGLVHTYRYCYKYQNTSCSAKDCPFLHCTSAEQYGYMMTSKATENLEREVGRTLQNTDICGDLKKKICTRTNCNRRHVKLKGMQLLECPICRDQIVMNSFGAVNCGHILCYNCALKWLNDGTDKEQSIRMHCPTCRFKGGYKKLM